MGEVDMNLELLKTKWNNLNKKGKTIVCVVAIVVIIAIIQSV
jgi:hypothetical protein